ncbi:MAG: EamA family transporter [Proteobacteria bacterium]|nr:EamA family transporter [Pseudomonadota bacterium]
MTPTPGTRDFVLLIALSLIWGSAFALIKIAVVTIPPISLATARVAVAAVTLLIILRLLGESLPADLRQWGRFAAIGMLGNGLPFVLIGYGELRVDSGLAAILIGTMPVFTVAFATLFRVERGLTWRRGLGLALGFAGLLVLVGPAALGGLGDDGGAHLAIVAAAASYAAMAVYAMRLSQTTSIVVLGAGTMVASTAIMVPVALVIDAPWTLAPAAEALGAVFILGLVATGFATLIFFKLLASAGATFASTINYLIPVIGVVLGVAWLGESIGVTELAAMALILSGVVLVRSGPSPQSS